MPIFFWICQLWQIVSSSNIITDFCGWCLCPVICHRDKIPVCRLSKLKTTEMVSSTTVCYSCGSPFMQLCNTMLIYHWDVIWHWPSQMILSPCGIKMGNLCHRGFREWGLYNWLACPQLPLSADLPSLPEFPGVSRNGAWSPGLPEL